MSDEGEAAKLAAAEQQTPTVDGMIAFYESANSALRIALIIVIAWPLAALAGAMAFHARFAQTIVPIIDLLPLGAVFFVVAGAPFGLLVLLKNSVVRKGFMFLCGLIGVELAIGGYLAVIPISRDRGLVPLLLIAAMALLFLWIAKFARWLQAVLTLALAVITVIFIAGGRGNLKSVFVAHGQFDYSADTFSTVTLPIASDGWAAEITLPHAWTAFTVAVNHNLDDPTPGNAWFAFRCSGSAGQLVDSGTKYPAGTLYAATVFKNCSGPLQFRGHASLVFATTAPLMAARAASPELADRQQVYRQDIVCSGKWNQDEMAANDHRRDRIAFFDVQLHQGCFGANGTVKIPTSWQVWEKQFINAHAGDEVGFWCAGWEHSIGPFGPNSIPEFNNTDAARACMLEGKGTIRYWKVR